MDGARGVLLSIAGGSDLGLFEINDAAQLVTDAAHPEANIIFGAVIDDALGDEVRITVIAAGFDGGQPQYRPADPPRKSAMQPEAAATPPPRTATPSDNGHSRRVLFDDVDVPDFLKNGA
jgi:cell division protein FtsZ